MTKTPNPLTLTVPRSHPLRDVAVVAFLAIILGAFVAQIASTPAEAASAPTAFAGVTLSPRA
ncbi:MAG TPA: hypothetical protein VMK42_03465 [Anaeromyxobacteraceae bacterium]|nr:hypothetical protein [Anaeromyxobacteraceae bacterium]